MMTDGDKRHTEKRGTPLNLGMILPHCKYPTKNYMKCHVAYYAGNISRGMIYRIQNTKVYKVTCTLMHTHACTQA